MVIVCQSMLLSSFLVRPEKYTFCVSITFKIQIKIFFIVIQFCFSPAPSLDFTLRMWAWMMYSCPGDTMVSWKELGFFCHISATLQLCCDFQPVVSTFPGLYMHPGSGGRQLAVSSNALDHTATRAGPQW